MASVCTSVSARVIAPHAQQSSSRTSPKAQVRATPAASNAASVRLGGARTGAALSASRSSTVTRAVKDYSAEHFAPSKTESQRWGYVIANAKFLLNDEEHLAELLRERRRMFKEKEREMDFFIVTEPAWIEQLPADVKGRLGRPAAAIVSTDLTWITFMKLRIDKCYKGEFDAMMSDALAANGGTDTKFEAPSSWVAPYPQYQQGWWKIFLPSDK